MRLFAAIPMPETAREALLDVLARLKQTGWPVRWVGEGNLHLTVKFYGDVPDEDVARLGEELAAAVRGTPVLPMQLTGVNAFPALRRPRVIWAAVDAPPALELMQHRVEQAAAASGFPPEGKAFRPHITLGRLKSSASLPRAAAEMLEQMVLNVAFEASRVVLFESRLSRQGAQHTALETLDLDRGGGA
ncbi:MAG: RNA 2',3'-cyclic phosphodiesterase [Gemmatimonadales bacterium]|nr:RNA 2',3'-cyclic phosphodiesterase [Gemmatimonadales bacterium]